MKLINVRISRNRSFMMGIACLWILYQHVHIQTSIYPLWALGRFGFTQVDLFLFLSGFGLYYALSKERNYLAFYRKRMTKVLPTYCFFAILYIIYAFLFDGMGFLGALGVLSCTSFWAGGSYVFSWFAHLLVFAYMIAPVIYLFASSTRKSTKESIYLIFTAFIVSLCFINSSLMIGVSRLVSFLLGMMVASRKDQECGHAKAIYAVSFLAMALAVIGVSIVELFGERLGLNGEKVIFLPLFMLPLGESLLLSATGDWLRKSRIGMWIVNKVEQIGTVTFDVYLLQTLVNLPIDKYIETSASVLNIIKIVVAVLCIPIAFTIHKHAIVPIQKHLVRKSRSSCTEKKVVM